MTQDEIATMDGGMCILQLRGVRPFFSKKYDITKHPRYKYLSDADKKNALDVERYIRVQRKKKKHPSAVIAPEEPFDLYEVELSDMDADFTVAVGENGCDFPTQNNSTWFYGGTNMAFFNSAVGVLQTLVIALGAGLGIWGVINLLEGYGSDNPGANAHVR